MAVLEGCKVINSRLEKFKKENPGGTWEDWVTAAFFARSSLFHMVTMMKNQTLIKMVTRVSLSTTGISCQWRHVNDDMVSKMTMVTSRVSLSTTGFHATPDIGYDFQTNSGNAFNYFTFGVGCSTVEIDCLTGDHHVLR